MAHSCAAAIQGTAESPRLKRNMIAVPAPAAHPGQAFGKMAPSAKIIPHGF
jgi:hypothetical protein